MSRYVRSLLATGLGLFCLLMGGVHSAAVDADDPPPINRWQETALLQHGLMGGHAIVSADNTKLFVLGGKNHKGELSHVVTADILPTGALANWHDDSQLPIPVYLHAVAQGASSSMRDLYLVGGWDDGLRYNNVWCTTVQGNQLGSWRRVGTYPEKIVLHTAAVVSQTLYVIGGVDEINTPLDRIRYANLTPGCISSTSNLTWITSTAPLPIPLFRSAATVHNETIYVIGGYDGQRERAEVFFAKVNAPGDLGGWQSAPHLPDPLAYHQVLVYENRLVVLGGIHGDEDSDRMYMAHIHSDGALSAWIRGPDLKRTGYRFAAAVSPRIIHGHPQYAIYMIGGFHDQNDYRRDTYVLLHQFWKQYIPFLAHKP